MHAKKTPDVEGIGWSSTGLQCDTCHKFIRRHRFVWFRVSYGFYYDFFLVYHLFCRRPKQMNVLPTEAF
jgi:hypothetical protein